MKNAVRQMQRAALKADGSPIILRDIAIGDLVLETRKYIQADNEWMLAVGSEDFERAKEKLTKARETLARSTCSWLQLEKADLPEVITFEQAREMEEKASDEMIERQERAGSMRHD